MNVGGGMKIQNHALGQGNQAYQGIKANRPNNLDFVKEVEKEKINNLNFVKEVEKNKNQNYAKGIEDNDETKKKRMKKL